MAYAHHYVVVCDVCTRARPNNMHIIRKNQDTKKIYPNKIYKKKIMRCILESLKFNDPLQRTKRNEMREEENVPMVRKARWPV